MRRGEFGMSSVTSEKASLLNHANFVRQIKEKKRIGLGLRGRQSLIGQEAC